LISVCDPGRQLRDPIKPNNPQGALSMEGCRRPSVVGTVLSAFEMAEPRVVSELDDEWQVSSQHER
jgi:hypothetical protein